MHNDETGASRFGLSTLLRFPTLKPVNRYIQRYSSDTVGYSQYTEGTMWESMRLEGARSFHVNPYTRAVFSTFLPEISIPKLLLRNEGIQCQFALSLSCCSCTTALV
jgi:hypothetical protein